MPLIEKPRGACDLVAWGVPLPPWDSDAALLAEQDKTFCKAKCVRKPFRDNLSRVVLVYTAKKGLRQPNEVKCYRAASLATYQLK